MKFISNAELAMIVTRLLDVSSSDLAGHDEMARFMTDLTRLVCDHAGGVVASAADNPTGGWLVGVEGNDSLPSDGGVWASFDPDGDLYDN